MGTIFKYLEPISKIGFWFKITAEPSLKPEAYCCMSRILNAAPTKILGQKTFLIWVLSVFLGILLNSQPPAVGGKLPEFTLSVPKNDEHQEYLGLAGKESFKISEISAEVVIIEIFSMY
jgi:hypothetical protein